jgi:hypothetical protein
MEQTSSFSSADEFEDFEHDEELHMADREGHWDDDLHTHTLVEECFGEGESTKSVYGQPISPIEADRLLPPGGCGLIWHAQLVRDDYSDSKATISPGVIKPRRPIPTVTETEFFSSLVQTPDGRWIFSGLIISTSCFQLSNYV